MRSTLPVSARQRGRWAVLGILACASTLAVATCLADEAKPRHFPKLSGGVTGEDTKLGTAITWARSIDEAAQEAERDNKLLFVIHVSGDFEDPECT